MSYGPVEIYNLALALLGQEPIHMFGRNEEDEPSARLGERVYNINRDLLVSEHDWGFARYTAELQQLTAEHPFGVRYKLPNDCFTPRKLLPRAGKSNNWLVESREIIIPTENTSSGGYTPYLVYTRSMSTSGTFPPYFVMALAFRIAAFVCMPLTKDIDLLRNLKKEAEYRVGRAALLDANVDRRDDEGEQDLWNDSFNDPDIARTSFDG